jgi:trigger factor
MKVEVTDLGAWRRSLEIEVPREDVDSRLKEAYKSYSKSMNLPGFRKGKIPVSVVKSRFGPAILEEVITKTEEEFYREASQEKGLHPVSQATIEESSYEDGEPLKFKASVDIKPELDIKTYKGLKVVRPVYKVDESFVENQLSGMREQGATEKQVERKAALGDVVQADFVELDEEGNEIADRAQSDRMFLIGGPNANHDLDNQLVGIEVGDTRDVQYTHTHEMEDGEKHEHEVRFRVVAKEIRERELPTLDDAFAKDMGPFESLEELKTRIRDDMKTQADQASRGRLVENLVEELIAKNEFEVPESMVDTYLENFIAQTKQERQVEELENEEEIREQAKPGALRGVKRYLILEQIAEKENIEVSEEDLDKHLETMSERHNVDGSRIRQILGRSGQLDRIKSDLLDEKAFDFVIEQAKVEDVEETPDGN